MLLPATAHSRPPHTAQATLAVTHQRSPNAADRSAPRQTINPDRPPPRRSSRPSPKVLSTGTARRALQGARPLRIARSLLVPRDWSLSASARGPNRFPPSLSRACALAQQPAISRRAECPSSSLPGDLAPPPAMDSVERLGRLAALPTHRGTLTLRMPASTDLSEIGDFVVQIGCFVLLLMAHVACPSVTGARATDATGRDRKISKRTRPQLASDAIFQRRLKRLLYRLHGPD